MWSVGFAFAMVKQHTSVAMKFNPENFTCFFALLRFRVLVVVLEYSGSELGDSGVGRNALSWFSSSSKVVASVIDGDLGGVGKFSCIKGKVIVAFL